MGTIELKNGRRITAKIIEKTDTSVRMSSYNGSIEMTISLKDIKTIRNSTLFEFDIQKSTEEYYTRMKDVKKQSNAHKELMSKINKLRKQYGLRPDQSLLDGPAREKYGVGVDELSDEQFRELLHVLMK